MSMERTEQFKRCLSERILVLDGAMGTMIQSYGLSEADFRTDRYAEHFCELKSNYDLLSLTQPDIIENIHREYLRAGADIIETNTFNSTAVSQSKFQTEEDVYDINFAAAQLARRVADEFTVGNPHKPRFVAGCLGPTDRTCGHAPGLDDPSKRGITFDELVRAYSLQVEALIDSGVDILIIETVFEMLNAKAAVFAIRHTQQANRLSTPIWISGTIIDTNRNTLAGQTTEGFWKSVSLLKPFCIGLNCGAGVPAMRPHVEELSRVADTLVSVHPSAGLPNESGEYDNTPEYMAEVLKEFAEDGLVNIVGGCCGTTPEHIHAIAEAVSTLRPRHVSQSKLY